MAVRVPNAIVRSTESRGTMFEGVATTTDRSGVFTFCAVSVNETIMTTAAAADGMSPAPSVEVEVPDSERVSMIRLEAAPVAVEGYDSIPQAIHQRIGMNVEALIIRRFQPWAVSGLKA
jgi:hypothetical protein